MTDRTSNAAPLRLARLGGAFYLLMMVTGGLATFARNGLIVKDDAAATAANILAHQPAFVASFAAEILVVAWYVVVTALFYQLFKPVSRSVSLLAAFFGLAGCIIQAGACVFYLAPLTVLGNGPYMQAFRAEQLPSLAYLFLKLYSQTYGIALIFFAFYCFLIGCLIFRSGFLPRFTGVLMALAGLTWMVFLSPLYAAAHLAYLMPFAIGEGVLTFWLLIAGVNVAKWHEKSRASHAALLEDAHGH